MERKLAKFIRPTYGCESDSEEIKKKWEEIIGNETDKAKIIEKLFLWVRDNIRYELDPIVGALNVLKRKTGGCVDKASLFIALCRAAGIPARYVVMTAKLITKKDIGFSELNHCTTEVYLNGKWKIIDPTFDPSLLSIFPQASLDFINWWDSEKSKILYRTREIDKKLSNIVSQSYEELEVNLKFKKVIADERS